MSEEKPAEEKSTGADDAVPESSADTILDALHRPKQKPLTWRERIDGSKALVAALSQPNNARVARIFVMTSLCMIVVPLVTLFAASNLAPHLYDCDREDAYFDCAAFGGLSAVASTLVVVVYYAVWAIRSDAEAEAAAKKKE